MINLRNYQDDSVKNAVSKLIEKQNHLLVAPTGAGKTVMLSKIIDDFLKVIGKDKNILCLVHRDKINEQNARTIKAITNRNVFMFDSKIKQCGQVTMAMVQTVSSVFEKLPSFDAVFIDECHHQMAESYIKIIESQKNKAQKNNKKFYLFGTTATPTRGDGESLLKEFTNFHQIQISFLIENGYLVKPNFIDLSPVVTVLKENKKGELKEKKVIGSLSKIHINELSKIVLNAYEKYHGKKTVIYCSNHDEIKHHKEFFAKNNIKSVSIRDDSTHEERLNDIKLFEDLSSDVNVLFNVDILTEGYDYPELDTIIIARRISDNCSGLFTQIVGRGTRPIDPAKSKTIKLKFNVIDLGDNKRRFGDLSQTVNGPDDFEDDKDISIDDILSGSKERNVNKEKNSFFTQEQEKVELLYKSKYDLFENIDDVDFGIVSVANTKKQIAVFLNKKGFLSNDKILFKEVSNELEKLNSLLEQEIHQRNKPMSDMQIEVLGAKYPIHGCDFYRANCLIAWDLFKKTLKDIQ